MTALPQQLTTLATALRDAVRRIEKLERRPLKTEDFIAPTLAGTWVNFGAPQQVAGYAKDPLGFVWIRGCVKNGGLIPSNIFTLPTGYRPPNDLEFPIDSAGGFGLLRIVAATGVVSIQAGAQASVWLTCSFHV
jgi:hypothetical protein